MQVKSIEAGGTDWYALENKFDGKSGEPTLLCDGLDPNRFDYSPNTGIAK